MHAQPVPIDQQQCMRRTLGVCTRAGAFKWAARPCSREFESTALLEMTEKRTDTVSISPKRVKKKFKSRTTAATLAATAARNQKRQEQEQAAARQADQATGPYTPAPGEAAEKFGSHVDTPEASGVDHSAAAGTSAPNGDYPTTRQFRSQLFTVWTSWHQLRNIPAGIQQLFQNLGFQIPDCLARPFGWLPRERRSRMIKSIKEVFMGPKACAGQGIPEYIELPVSIVTSLHVKDQVAVLKRLVQDIPREVWHRTEKELKLRDGSSAWDEAMLHRTMLPVDKDKQKFCKLRHTLSDNQWDGIRALLDEHYKCRVLHAPSTLRAECVFSALGNAQMCFDAASPLCKCVARLYAWAPRTRRSHRLLTNVRILVQGWRPCARLSVYAGDSLCPSVCGPTHQISLRP
jgi:hypothetical protein